MIKPLKSSSGFLSFVLPRTEPRIKATFRNAATFPTYHRHFRQCGLGPSVLAKGSAFQMISSLRPVHKDHYAELQSNSLVRQACSRFTTDWTSGSTTKPILKLTSGIDEEAEAEAVRRSFRGIGLDDCSHLVCLDVGASDIYLFYARILGDMGVKRISFVKATKEYGRCVQNLASLASDALITVPSLLAHCIDELVRQKEMTGRLAIRKIVYIGEPMDRWLQTMVRERLGSECYSFYGTTEVGSIGIECRLNDGIHIPLDLVVPTLVPLSGETEVRPITPTRYEGVVAWTSLKFRDHPVVMYCVGDQVEIETAPCACGDAMPRMYFGHRVDHTFSLFGITFKYDLIMAALQRALKRTVHAEVHLSGSNKANQFLSEQLTIILSERYRADLKQCRNQILSIHPIQDFVERGLLKISFRLVSTGYFHRRKTRVLRLSKIKEVQDPYTAMQSE